VSNVNLMRQQFEVPVLVDQLWTSTKLSWTRYWVPIWYSIKNNYANITWVTWSKVPLIAQKQAITISLNEKKLVLYLIVSMKCRWWRHWEWWHRLTSLKIYLLIDHEKNKITLDCKLQSFLKLKNFILIG
jgi:hypothetical protein